MARPISTRPTVRVQTEGRPQSPGLGVFAPLEVRTPGPETSPLGGLIQALGIVGMVGQQAVKQRKDYYGAQGAADEQIGEADPKKVPKMWQKSYADGAYQVAIIEQYHEAEQKVAERAASDDLDKSLPVEQQTHIVDGWMKSELGPLVADDRAKLLIGERYQTFINKFSAGVLQGQVEAHAKAAEDAAVTDINARMDNGAPVNYDEEFHRLYSQTGDAVRSNELLVGIAAQRIEDAASRGEDYESIRNWIPTQSIGPNGEKLPGPMYNPKYRGILNQAMQNGERLRDKFYESKYATAEFQARASLDRMLEDGTEITEDTFKAAGYTIGTKPGDTLSPALAAQYMQESRRKAAALKAQDAEYQGALAMRGEHGRWADIEHLGGLTPEKVADAADRQLQTALLGLGFKPEDLSGIGLASNPQLIDAVAGWSASEGVVYRPLKDTLNSINPAAPGDMQGRLEAYEALKAKNLTGLYVDDKSALVYEAAIGAKQAGLGRDETANFIRTMGDKATSAAVSDAMSSKPFQAIRKTGFELKTGNLLLNRVVSSKAAANPAYLAGKYESLVSFALSQGQPLDKAQAFAQDRIQQTHTALQFSGKYAFIPSKEVGNPADAQAALDWYQTKLPELKQKAGVPDDEPVTIVPRTSLNGRALTIEVQRLGGTPIQGGTVNLQGLVQTFLRIHPKKSGQQQAADFQATEGKRAFQFKASQPVNLVPQPKQ